LNSPITSLYLEFQRTIMGLGVVEATVDEATAPCPESTITVKTKDGILRQL
jgi:hypothetical protein